MKTEEKRIHITGSINPHYEEILTKEAMEFIGRLERHFGGRRRELLHLRTIRQAEIDQGKNPCFLAETKHIREADWTVAPLPGIWRTAGLKSLARSTEKWSSTL